MVAALLLDLVEAYADQTAARGSALLTVDALNLGLAASLVVLILRQVLPIAARLGGGLALSGFGSVEGAARRAFGVARGVAYVAADSLPESEPPRVPVWRPVYGGRAGGAP